MVTPPSNLPPEAQPWARDVEANQRANAQAINSLQQANVAAFAGINSSLQSISNQITIINQNSADIAAQTAALAAQTAALAVAVSDISTLSSNQVSGSTGSASASPTLTTTATGYAAITFTVPTGFTRANVMGVSSMYMGGTVASILRTQIAGSNGPDMFAFTNAAYANASASHARSLTGLSGGGTFTVVSVANTSTGSTSGVILTSASVIWLK